MLNTLSKVLSTCVADDLVYQAERLKLLPEGQFGGRPGCTTTYAIHTVTVFSKTAWRQGDVAVYLFLDVVRPSLGPMRDLVVVGGAAVGRRGSANYVGGCWRSSHIRCRKCAVGYAARNASAHHKAVHRQQRHHRQRSTWRSDHNRLLGSGGSAAASVMSSEAQNAHGARGTVGAVR